MKRLPGSMKTIALLVAVGMISAFLPACEALVQNPSLRPHDYALPPVDERIGTIELHYEAAVPGSNLDPPATYVPAILANAEFREYVERYFDDELQRADLRIEPSLSGRKLTCNFVTIQASYMRYLYKIEPGTEVSVEMACHLNQPEGPIHLRATGISDGRSVSLTQKAIHRSLEKIVFNLVSELAARLRAAGTPLPPEPPGKPD